MCSAPGSSAVRTPKHADLGRDRDRQVRDRQVRERMSASACRRAHLTDRGLPAHPIYGWTLVTCIPRTASNRPRLPSWGADEDAGRIGGCRRGPEDGRLRADHDHRNSGELGACGAPEPDKSPELAACGRHNPTRFPGLVACGRPSTHKYPELVACGRPSTRQYPELVAPTAPRPASTRNSSACGRPSTHNFPGLAACGGPGPRVPEVALGWRDGSTTCRRYVTRQGV
ncbi:MAG: hypothetical protein QOE61_3316 [Micromonosporaceae bacterium]|jgi:hypothetical protein|nr:hypothetical protein [Micromonosporaceae bacterium]